MDVTNRPHALEVGSLPNNELFSPVTPTTGPRFPQQSKEQEQNFEEEEYGEEEDYEDDEQYINGTEDFVIPTERNEDPNDTLTHELDLLSIDDANESLLSRQSDPSREKESKTTLTLKEQEKVKIRNMDSVRGILFNTNVKH